MTTRTATVTMPTDREIVITREFNAPRRLVFEAWTNPEYLPQWMLGPDGWTMTICEIDLRPGGKWHFIGRGPKGQAPDFYGVFREVAPPDRLVYTEIFAPFPDVESVVTTVLTEESGKTRITVNCLYPSKDVRDMVVTSGMERGAAISYDRLEDLVRALQG